MGTSRRRSYEIKIGFSGTQINGSPGDRLGGNVLWWAKENCICGCEIAFVLLQVHSPLKAEISCLGK
jgi:hypothetical protein